MNRGALATALGGLAGCSLMLDTEHYPACGTAGAPACADETDGGGPDTPGDGGEPDAVIGPLDPIRWYRMDEDPPSGIESINGVDGGCTVCPTSADGAIGAGFRFDGDATVELPSNAIFSSATGTISIWVLRSTAGSADVATLVGRPCAEPCILNTWGLEVVDEDQIAFRVGDLVIESDLPDGPIPAEAWVHVAAVWREEGEFRLLVGGERVAEAVQPVTFPLGGAAAIGGGLRSDGDAARTFDGVLDDLRVFDRALTDGEIAVLAGGR